MSIIRVQKTREYFSVPNATFNDENLSWEVRGLLAYLLGKPDEFFLGRPTGRGLALNVSSSVRVMTHWLPTFVPILPCWQNLRSVFIEIPSSVADCFTSSNSISELYGTTNGINRVDGCHFFDKMGNVTKMTAVKTGSTVKTA